MKKTLPNVLTYVVLLQFSITFSMANVAIQKDSLQAKSYQYFLEKIDAIENAAVAIPLIQTWINKAKLEKNDEQLVEAYTQMMHKVPAEVALNYSDSIMFAAQRSGSQALQGSALISRGIIFYKRRKYKEALDYYLQADAKLSTTNDAYLQHKVTFVIAQLKYHLGYYEESRAIFTECTTYFMPRDTIPYLRAVHGLSMSLNMLQEYDEAAVANKTGLALAYLAEDRAVVPYLTQADGITAYGKKRYSQAVSQLRMALPAMKQAKDYASEGITWLYLGKSLLALKQPDSATLCFEQIDRIFSAHGYINPPLREGYELLIAHYDQRGDEKKSLHYFRQLQAADKIFSRDYRHLYDKISGIYNPSVLKREVAEIERILEQERLEKRLGYGMLCAICIVGVYLAMRYKKNNTPTSNTIVEVQEKQTAQTIVAALSPVQVAKVKAGLDKFEKIQEFRQSKLSLYELSKKLGSNPKYVASIIIHDKGCNHTCYLNNLRIQYVIEKLKNDPHFKKYAIKEIAKDAGFATSNSFANEFRERIGMLPSDYIKAMSS